MMESANDLVTSDDRKCLLRSGPRIRAAGAAVGAVPEPWVRKGCRMNLFPERFHALAAREARAQWGALRSSKSRQLRTFASLATLCRECWKVSWHPQVGLFHARDDRQARLSSAVEPTFLPFLTASIIVIGGLGGIDARSVEIRGDQVMFMRIVWGKILPGKWDEFETAFTSAMAARGDLPGLKDHWLARDQEDRNAGYSITLWNSEQDMRAFWDSPKRKEVMAALEPFFVNQFTATHCEVRYALRA